MKLKYFLISCFIMLGLWSCDKIIPSAPQEHDTLDGPMADLSPEQLLKFNKGDVAFGEVFTSQTGLGPGFVANSCVSCHAADGKGHPENFLIRFGQTSPGLPPNTAIGGPQLQHRAIPGHLPEQLPQGVASMKLLAPSVTGLGLLAALTDAQLLANEDIDDTDQDGISGRANFVDAPAYFQAQPYHINQNGKYLGRFGKKAAVIDLIQQIVSAYNQDMGITSTYEPLDPLTKELNDPEVSDKTIADLHFYIRTLKAPIQRTKEDADVQSGKNLFTQINCNSCHIETWTTPQSDIAALSNKTFHPYTDLLLHDMGPELDEGATEGNAQSFEWRTAPLWGLGLSAASQGGTMYLMHDGRAHSIEEAILLHNGEAAASKGLFQNLDEAQQQQLVNFLESL